MLNLRSSIEAIVKTKNASKKCDQSFVFGEFTWKTLMIKKFLATFTPEQSLLVTVIEKNGYPAMNFQWANGSAFIYAIEAMKTLEAKAKKEEKDKWNR